MCTFHSRTSRAILPLPIVASMWDSPKVELKVAGCWWVSTIHPVSSSRSSRSKPLALVRGACYAGYVAFKSSPITVGACPRRSANLLSCGRNGSSGSDGGR